MQAFGHTAQYEPLRDLTGDESHLSDSIPKEFRDQRRAMHVKLTGRHADPARRYAGLVPYHEEMSRKYRDAARKPWLPLAPDPPKPSDPGDLRYPIPEDLPDAR